VSTPEAPGDDDNSSAKTAGIEDEILPLPLAKRSLTEGARPLNTVNEEEGESNISHPPGNIGLLKALC
jgi:hypothetical protein